MSRTTFSSQPPTHLQLGLTLVELMVTLGILAILTGLAAPSFTSLFERWRAGQAISALESALFHARAESIRRGSNLVLIRHTNDSICTAPSDADWRCGWALTMAADKSTVLQDSNKTFHGIALTASASVTEISLDRWGGMHLGDAGNSLSFTATSPNGSSTSGRRLCISAGGQMVQKSADQSC